MSFKAVRRRSFAGAMAVLAVGASIFGNMAISAPEAKADAETSGPGYLVRDMSGSSASVYHWAGAFEGPDGNLAWCVEAGKISSRPAAYSGFIDNAQLSAALSLYEGVDTADSRAALALLVHEKADIGPEWAQWVNDVQAAYPAVRELADTYWANAETFKDAYYIDSNDPVTEDGGKTYTVSNISIRSHSDVVGYQVTVTIPDNSPGVFDDGSKSNVIDSGGGVTVRSTGTGTIQLQYSASGLPGNSDLLTYREAPNLQTMLVSAPSASASGNSATINASTAFQPTIKSKVQSEFITEGSAPVDNLTVGLDKTVGDSWMEANGKPIEVTFKGTLYGPYDAPQDASQIVPENAPVAATATVTADKVGDVKAGADVKVSKSGYYTWVWTLNKAEQSPEAQKFIDADYTDGFFTEGETSIVKMKPTITTVADNRTVKPGDPMIDNVTLSLSDGGKWLTNKDGSKLAIPANGTLYGPFDQPMEQSDQIPADAPVAGHENIVFDESGTKATTGEVKASGPGFYTWVWKIDDSNYYEGYQTPFMEFAESSVVKHEIKHESKARENIVQPGAQFAGTQSGWKGDLGTAHVTVYGPMENEPSTAEVPADAPVFKKFDVEAKNGVYNIGDDEATKVAIPEDGFGHYVFVYSFDGDDRVAPFQSAFNDKDDQFFVPAPKLSVTTQATTALAHTGADILPFVGAGVVLIGVAAGVIVARRRRHAEEVASE